MSREHDKLSSDLELEPTAGELEQAAALRDALEGKQQHPDAALARALRAAHAPQDLDDAAHKRLIDAALQRAPSRRATVIRLFGTASALALAAAVALLVLPELLDDSGERSSAGISTTLVRSRSTQSLFEEPFAPHSGTSTRIDTIARARERDFRNNLFASRGVR